MWKYRKYNGGHRKQAGVVAGNLETERHGFKKSFESSRIWPRIPKRFVRLQHLDVIGGFFVVVVVVGFLMPIGPLHCYHC